METGKNTANYSPQKSIHMITFWITLSLAVIFLITLLTAEHKQFF